MKHITIILLLAALLVACGKTGVSNLNDSHMAHVSDIKSGIIGDLGKRLGTYMEISGVEVGHPTNKYIYMLSDDFNMLEVSQVDGITLKESVRIAIVGTDRFQYGVHYRLKGYETGEMFGRPGTGPEVQIPLQFANYFVETKVIEQNSK
jgi:hypothetical protein